MTKDFARLKGLYAIVDDSFPDPVGTAKEILQGGCRVIQFRAKNAPSSEFLSAALKIAGECRTKGALFIINDRIDIAMLCGADGVHLGQEDTPLSAARKLMGKKKIIGISTHNGEEIAAAQRCGADYAGFGPVFKTSTKHDAQAEQGIKKLEEIARTARIPLIAIGGINEENIQLVMNAGAYGAAVISDIANAKDRREKTSRLVHLANGKA